MAYYDHMAAEEAKNRKFKFEEHLEKLKTENIDVYMYISMKLGELEKAKKRIEEYQNFFKTLNSFLPDNSPMVFK